MRAKWWLGLSLLVVVALASASQRAEIHKQVEASMLLTGTIDIEPDGSVGGHAIDDSDKVPEAVLANIARTVPGWRFEPVLVDGRAVRARTRMTLRMLAVPVDEDNAKVGIADASFGEYEYDAGATDRITVGRMTAPAYPPEAYQIGGQGDVYLLVKVGRDGKVIDVVAEQVNLTVVGRESELARIRGALEKASLKAARRWTFRPPTTGDEVDEPYWSARVPVAFMLHGKRAAAYGEWKGYVPGPRKPAPWLSDDEAVGSDALVAGGVYPVGGSGIRLLNPPGAG